MNNSQAFHSTILLKRRKKGFTLIEILIVLALIGVIATLTMSNIGGIFGGSQVKAAQQWVNSTGEAYVTSYLTLVGEYPSSLSDLKNRSGEEIREIESDGGKTTFEIEFDLMEELPKQAASEESTLPKEAEPG